MSSGIDDALPLTDRRAPPAVAGRRERRTAGIGTVVSGEVVHGDQRGRVLGFPTANLRIAPDSPLKFGVYAGRLDGRPAAINIGVRPTFGTNLTPMLEAFVLDFTGDLYGQHVRVELVEFLRGELSFDSSERLVEQMDEDVRVVRDVFAELDRDAISRTDRAIYTLARGMMAVLDGSSVGHGSSHLVVAAGHASAPVINQLTFDARGLVTLAMPRTHCQQLGLRLQTRGRHDSSRHGYALSIEARHGVSTGISAHDRAVTVATASAPDAGPDDIVVPGHVVPIQAADGGVLERPGLAEAAIDLARLSGRFPAAVCCAMLDDHGDAAGHDDVVRYAERNGLVTVSLADVIAYLRHRAMQNLHVRGS